MQILAATNRDLEREVQAARFRDDLYFQLKAWSADGRQLYYLAGDRVVAAAVNDSASFSASAARPVEALGDRIVGFSASASGRIVAVREVDPGKPPLTLVRSWQQLLGEK